jgi:hypothetical protein
MSLPRLSKENLHLCIEKLNECINQYNKCLDLDISCDALAHTRNDLRKSIQLEKDLYTSIQEMNRLINALLKHYALYDDKIAVKIEKKLEEAILTKENISITQKQKNILSTVENILVVIKHNLDAEQGNYDAIEKEKQQRHTLEEKNLDPPLKQTEYRHDIVQQPQHPYPFFKEKQFAAKSISIEKEKIRQDYNSCTLV